MRLEGPAPVSSAVLRAGIGALFILSTLFVLACSSDGGAAEKDEPADFGKARFGMTAEEVRELYPDMEILKRNLGASSVGGPFVQRFVLAKHEVPGVRTPTSVEFRFWKDHLWVVIVYFRSGDLDTVTKALTERYGPFKGKPENAVWSREKTTVMVAGKAKWYSLHDNAISEEAQAAVMEDVKRSMERRKAQFRELMARAGHSAATTPTPPQTAATAGR